MKEEVAKVVKDLGELKELKKLAGDASTREFYRAFLDNGQSYVLMKLADSLGPLHSGVSRSQSDSFVEIGKYLYENDFLVPKILIDAREQGYLVVEDLGDKQLASVLLDRNPSSKDLLESVLLYIRKIQTLKGDNIIFQREISEENYLEESMRFVTNYLPETEISDQESELVKDGIRSIAKAVANHSKVVIYRDLMPWNIMYHENQLYLIDFQDMLIGSYSYDLMSFLHDRDIDFALGDDMIRNLIGQFIKSNDLDSSFYQHYYQAIAQRHLRLAGQFLLLTKKTGKEIYANWVPGCLYRSGRAIACIEKLNEMGSILAKYIPKFKEGFVQAYEYHC